jgi:hypothetical protein
MAMMLEQIREGEAPAELAGAYRDIRHCLRTSFVPLFFRTLAPHRGLLRAVWQQLRPNVITRAFEEEASDMRAALATSAVNLGTRLIEPVLASAGVDVDELDELREQVNLFHYTDPKTLLCLRAMRLVAEGGVVGGRHELRRSLLESIPTDAAADVPELILTSEEPGGVIGEVLHEIMRVMALPVAEVDLRAFAHWPEFIEPAWEEVGPIFQHRNMNATLIDLQERATRLVDFLPHRIDASKELLGQTPEALATVARVTSAIEGPMLRLALFVAALKVALDGPQEALDSPYPVEWEEPSVDQLEIT